MPSSNEVRLYSQGGYVGMSQIVTHERTACSLSIFVTNYRYTLP